MLKTKKARQFLFETNIKIQLNKICKIISHIANKINTLKVKALTNNSGTTKFITS